MDSWRVGKKLRLGHHSNLSLHTSPGLHTERGRSEIHDQGRGRIVVKYSVLHRQLTLMGSSSSMKSSLPSWLVSSSPPASGPGVPWLPQPHPCSTPAAPRHQLVELIWIHKIYLVR